MLCSRFAHALGEVYLRRIASRLQTATSHHPQLSAFKGIYDKKQYILHCIPQTVDKHLCILMYFYICIYLHIHIYIYIHIHIHIYVNIYIYICMSIYTTISISTGIYMYICKFCLHINNCIPNLSQLHRPPSHTRQRMTHHLAVHQIRTKRPP